MKKNLPSDIKSKALRETYYMVQKVIADRYDCALSKTTNPEMRQKLKEQFQNTLQDTINYYTYMC